MSVSLAKASDNVEDTRPHVDQCEGCYGPLGDLLDTGKEISDYRVTWYLCSEHDGSDNVPHYAELPYDEYDDYHN